MAFIDDIYQSVLRYCTDVKGITQQARDTFLDTLFAKSIDGSNIILVCDDKYKKNIIEHGYLAYIKEGFQNALGFEVNVEIEVDENLVVEAPALELVEEADSLLEEMVTKHHELEESFSKAKYEYTFDTFIVGSSNNFAYAACKSITEKGNLKNNPLFIHGPSGLGKTHLIYAIANELTNKYPGIKIRYSSTENYLNDYVDSIQHKTTDKFRKNYRDADIFLLDDVQFLSKKDQLQEELFHTFNDLYERGKQIVLTSDKPAKNIELLEDRVKTRFEWGLIAEIAPPELETRIAIVKRKAELLELKIDDDIANTIASLIKENIRQLESAVKKMKAMQHYSGINPNIALAHSIAKDVISDENQVTVSVEKIIEIVGQVYNVTADEIRSSNRRNTVSQARKVAAYIIKEVTQMPLQSIGDELGNRDHSTIVYSINNIKEAIDKDENLKNLVNNIINNINSGKMN